MASKPKPAAPKAAPAVNAARVDEIAIRQRLDLDDQPWEVSWGDGNRQHFATVAAALAFVPE